MIQSAFDFFSAAELDCAPESFRRKLAELLGSCLRTRIGRALERPAVIIGALIDCIAGLFDGETPFLKFEFDNVDGVVLLAEESHEIITSQIIPALSQLLILPSDLSKLDAPRPDRRGIAQQLAGGGQTIAPAVQEIMQFLELLQNREKDAKFHNAQR